MATSKAAPAKKAPAKKKPSTITEKMTKSQIIQSLSDSTELSRKQVTSVLDGLEDLIAASIKKKGVKEFTLPGLMKISTIEKPAVKARKGINPFTKEEVVFKAKPKSTAVKVRPLKKLKEFANG
jgi:nucleoid DNA-binding protein